ncbi:hypothetical protein [Streptomyces sp. NRRL B-24484]|uniref:hypothetical protein n=1 Tax=Streptomyces sp. NRRL B-24484 TaxID=1463833 RepID=UPI0004C1857B|nr:hypothetical protein [Streptomyces sp. NRRL B-24484]
MPEPFGPQQRIAEAIGPAMVSGLRGAVLRDSEGERHIAAWVDWIAEVVALQVVQPIAEERDAFADRVDTLSEVAKRNKEGRRDALRDVSRLESRVAELEAEVTLLRAAAVTDPEA